MTTPEEPATLPTMLAVEASNPTPASMQAVTIESRVATIESQLRGVSFVTPKMLTEFRAEFAELRKECRLMVETAIAEEATKREAADAALAAKITGSLEELLSIMKPFKSVLGHPKVQTALIGLALAVIFALTGWLTSKGHVTP